MQKFGTIYPVIFILILQVIALSFFPQNAFSQDNSYIPVYKAASIYKFINYINFDDNDDKIDVCVVGNQLVYKLLQKTMEKRMSVSREIISELYEKPDKEIKNCDFAYISSQVKQDVYKISGIISGSEYPIITISDIEGFNDEFNGLIEMFEDKGRVKFKINLKKSISLDVNISSKLIESAQDVY